MCENAPTTVIVQSLDKTNTAATTTTTTNGEDGEDGECYDFCRYCFGLCSTSLPSAATLRRIVLFLGFVGAIAWYVRVRRVFSIRLPGTEGDSVG